MSRSQAHNPALKKATYAALIAASFAVGPSVEAESVASIEQYCSTSWRQAGIPQYDWEDCTQETLLELLSRLPQHRLTQAIDEPKSSARRELMRSVWCVAQRWRRSASRRPVSLDVLADRADNAHSTDALADAEWLRQGLEKVSATQREILSLWAEGHSIAEISKALDLPAPRVSDLKYKAIKSLQTSG